MPTWPISQRAEDLSKPNVPLDPSKVKDPKKALKAKLDELRKAARS